MLVTVLFADLKGNAEPLDRPRPEEGAQDSRSDARIQDSRRNSSADAAIVERDCMRAAWLGSTVLPSA